MVESFRINAVLNLKSNAVPELAMLGQKFQQFDTVIKESTKQIKAFEAALSGLGTTRKLGGLVASLHQLGQVKLNNLSGLAGLSHLSHLGSINTAGINKIASSMSKLGGANLGGLSGHLSSLVTPLTTIHNLQQGIATAAQSTAAAWNAIATHIHAASGAMKTMPPQHGPQTPGGGTGSSHGGGSGGQAIQDASAGASSATGYLEQGLGGIYKGGMDAGEALAKLSLAGFTATEVLQANNRAFEVQQKVAGSTVGGNLEIMKDVYSVLQDAPEAIAATNEFAAMGVVLGKVGHGDQIKELFGTIRAGELAGAINQPGADTIDPALLSRFMHGLTNVVVKTGGRVTPSDYVAFFQQAGIAGARLSEDARFNSLPAVMMAMKSVRAGTALQSFQQSEFGHLAGGYGEAQAKIGLFKASDLEKIGKGPSRHIRTGALKNSEDLQENPVHWIWDTLMPLLKSAVNPAGKLNPAQETNAMLLKLYDLFPRNTITRIVEDIIRNKPLIEKDERALSDSLKNGTDFNQKLGKDDPKLHQDTAAASWDALNKAIGQATSSQAVGILDGITGSLNKLSDWARANPKDAAFYTDLAAGLAVVTTAIAAMGVVMLVIQPAAVAMTAALGGAVIVGALAAHYFPGKHAPGETSPGDKLLDALGINPGKPLANPGNFKIDMLPNIDFGYAGSRASPDAANSNQPGGSPNNPVYTHNMNETSGRDIANGVTSNQSRGLSGPRAGPTGQDGSMMPQYLPTPF